MKSFLCRITLLLLTLRPSGALVARRTVPALSVLETSPEDSRQHGLFQPLSPQELRTNDQIEMDLEEAWNELDEWNSETSGLIDEINSPREEANAPDRNANKDENEKHENMQEYQKAFFAMQETHNREQTLKARVDAPERELKRFDRRLRVRSPYRTQDGSRTSGVGQSRQEIQNQLLITKADLADLEEEKKDAEDPEHILPALNELKTELEDMEADPEASQASVDKKQKEVDAEQKHYDAVLENWNRIEEDIEEAENDIDELEEILEQLNRKPKTRSRYPPAQPEDQGSETGSNPPNRPREDVEAGSVQVKRELDSAWEKLDELELPEVVKKDLDDSRKDPTANPEWLAEKQQDYNARLGERRALHTQVIHRDGTINESQKESSRSNKLRARSPYRVPPQEESDDETPQTDADPPVETRGDVELQLRQATRDLEAIWQHLHHIEDVRREVDSMKADPGVDQEDLRAKESEYQGLLGDLEELHSQLLQVQDYIRILEGQLLRFDRKARVRRSAGSMRGSSSGSSVGSNTRKKEEVEAELREYQEDLKTANKALEKADDPEDLLRELEAMREDPYANPRALEEKEEEYNEAKQALQDLNEDVARCEFIIEKLEEELGTFDRK